MKLVIPPIGYTKCIKMLPRFVRTKDTSRSFCTCGFCTPSHASLAAALQIAHGGGPAKGWINWEEPSKIIQRSRCKGLRSLERLLVFPRWKVSCCASCCKAFFYLAGENVLLLCLGFLSLQCQVQTLSFRSNLQLGKLDWRILTPRSQVR